MSMNAGSPIEPGHWTFSGPSAPAGQRKPSTTTSRFESLPPELRNYIYELVLVERYGISLSMRLYSQKLWMTFPSRKSNVMALTTVSRGLRKESLPIFFSVNDFRFKTTGSHKGTPIVHEREFTFQLTCVNSWLKAVGEQDIRRIGSLTVDVSSWLFPGRVDDDVFPAWYQKLCGRVRAAIRNAPVGIDRVFVKIATVDDRGVHYACLEGCQVHELSNINGEGGEALDTARGSELTNILINRRSGP